MNKLVKYSIIILFCTAGAVFGQTPPTSVEVEGVRYFRHGFNEDGGPFVTGSANREVRDSVTVTSTVKYFVLPNPALNPSYNVSDPLANVRSTFTWKLVPDNLGDFVGDDDKAMIEVKWGNTPGAVTLSVVEVPADPTCDVIPTSIPVQVIPVPTAKHVQNAAGQQPYYSVFCFSINDTEVNKDWDFEIDVATHSSQVEVSYTVSKDGVNVPELARNNVPLGVENGDLGIEYNRRTGTFTVPFPDLGEYVVTLTHVTDRVARKSGVDGEIPIDAVGRQFTVRVFRELQTSPIYRVPNNFN